MRWRATQTGFYVDRAFHPLSSGLDFLRFPLLGLWSKFRLAVTILYCSRIHDWRRLEGMTVEEFLVRYSGRATFEKMWKPLLLAKLGENYRRVSAVFIWTYVKRLFSARDAAAQKEHLGYVSGGYRTVFKRLLELIGQVGGEVRTGVEVQSVRPRPRRHRSRGRRPDEVFDKVIFTGPGQRAARGRGSRARPGSAAGRRRVPRRRLHGARHAQAILSLLRAQHRRRAHPVHRDHRHELARRRRRDRGLCLTYLPKYVLSDDPMLGGRTRT